MSTFGKDTEGKSYNTKIGWWLKNGTLKKNRMNAFCDLRTSTIYKGHEGKKQKPAWLLNVDKTEILDQIIPGCSKITARTGKVLCYYLC